MSEGIWIEDELLPAEGPLEGAVKSIRSFPTETLIEAFGPAAVATKGRATLAEDMRRQARGVARLNCPQIIQVAAGKRPDAAPTEMAAPPPVAGSRRYFLKLGLELSFIDPKYDGPWHYAAAWCRARFFADPVDASQPRVVDIFPLRHYADEPERVRVELGPKISAGPMEAGLGSVSADLRVGYIAPVTLGYFGDHDREPYWVIRQKSRHIHGHHDFWLTLDLPSGSDLATTYLQLTGEGDLRWHVLTIPLGPRRRTWEERPRLSLAEVLGGKMWVR